MSQILWEKLQEFDLDAAAQFSFSRRLARDNGWSHEFALRVCDEYKKFLYLACTAGHHVTPSDEVDQAWHLHLTYSRSYWDELCAKVLEQPFHHDPTRGGQTERTKFVDWYSRTLDSYRKAFDAEPPLDIWPTSKIRFGEAPHFRRVNVRRHYVIAKPQFKAANLKVAPAVVLALVLAGCSASGSPNPFDWYGGEFLAFYWTLCGVCVAAYTFIRYWLSGPNDDIFPSQKFDPYVLARLANRGNLPVDAALCSLQEQGLIRVDSHGVIIAVAGAAPPRHPFEKEVLNTLQSCNQLGQVESKMRGTVESYDTPLQAAGMVIGDEPRVTIQLTALGMGLVLLLVGAIKIMVGLQRERPVGFLVCSCIFVIVAVWLALTTLSPHRTHRGERYLNKLRNIRARDDVYDVSTGVGMLVATAALYGVNELNAYGYDNFKRQPPSSSGGGDSGSSGSDGGGDGGSGCGGGCGGCGS